MKTAGGNAEASESTMKKSIVLAIFALAMPCAHAEVPTQIKREHRQQEVIQKIKAQRFASLEAQADRLMRSKERDDDGQWALAGFYHALESGMDQLDAREADKLEAQLLQFARTHANASNAWLMYVAALNARAWHIRGNGFRDSVTEEKWRGFKRYVARARTTLDEHQAQSADNPAWHAYRLLMSMYASETDEAFERRFQAGIKVEPTYHELFFTKMRHLFPIWGGSQDDMVKFANEAVRQVGNSEGVSIYARLAWVADSGGYPEMKASKSIDWNLMKRSFADLLNAYPADWNAQKLFFMACERPDKAEAQRILKYVKEAPSAILLGGTIPAFQMCVDWANGKVPAFLMRNPQTGETKLIQ